MNFFTVGIARQETGGFTKEGIFITESIEYTAIHDSDFTITANDNLIPCAETIVKPFIIRAFVAYLVAGTADFIFAIGAIGDARSIVANRQHGVSAII